jgi:DNA-directed RNA polymerase specialized sigma24 family protein
MVRAVPLSNLTQDFPTGDEEQSNREEVARAIHDQLARLPRREREAVEARTGLSGESCRTVAKRYRTCVQTVCNWASAAEAKLRAALGDYR